MPVIFTAILSFAVASGSANCETTDAPSPSASAQVSAAPDNRPVFESRKPAEMRSAVSSAMRATATSKSAPERDAAVRRLILVLLELEQDQNLTHDERVELHSQVRSRLMAIEQTLRA